MTTPKKASWRLKIAVDDTVKKVNREAASRGMRAVNAIRNAELEVLSGKRSGRVYRKPHTSGLRAGWCFGNLNDGGNDGVACRNSNNSVGNANWNGSLGATGYERNVYPKIIAPQHPRLCAKIA